MMLRSLWQQTLLPKRVQWSVPAALRRVKLRRAVQRRMATLPWVRRPSVHRAAQSWTTPAQLSAADTAAKADTVAATGCR
jgi:hypothetical protein